MQKIWIALLLITQSLFADSGTLVVTYQLDSDNSDLEDIRFWLKKESQKHQLYPKEGTYSDDPHEKIRTVVIEGLESGDYEIEFLIPNPYDHFNGIPSRTINIPSGGTIKIDQTITSKKQEDGTGRLVISILTDDDHLNNLAQMRFRLVGPAGKISLHPSGSENVVSLSRGRMIMIPNLPTGSYSLEFFREGNDGSVIEQQQFHLAKDQTKSIHQFFNFNVLNNP